MDVFASGVKVSSCGRVVGRITDAIFMDMNSVNSSRLEALPEGERARFMALETSTGSTVWDFAQGETRRYLEGVH